jgi:hypothetical protein
MEFSKKNLTYIIIFIFILLSLIHLVNIKDNHKDNYNDNDNDSSIIKENFITLTEDQIFAPDADAIIPSTDLVQFGELGTSKAANNLSQIINNITTNNTENATKINTLAKTIVNLSSNINVLESTVTTLKINNKLDLDNIRAGKINIGVGGTPLKNTITCSEPMFISTTGDLTLETTTNVNITGSLKSSGGISATNGLSMTGSGNDGIGGTLSITNTDKIDPKQAYTWAIYNMNNYAKDITGGPGKPGSGLSFWRYAKDKACTGGGMCDRHMTLNDDGTTFFGSSVIIDGMQELAGPNSTTRITAQGIIFGGANNGREANSAQISVGKHIANSLNIIGMSTGTEPNTRKIDMWAEGGMTVYGRLTASSVNATNGLSMTGSGGGGVGGAITIINTDKGDPKQAYTWAIYNMNNYGKDYTGGPGKPGSGLSFWRYAKDKACVGGMCDRHMTLNDDGSTFFGGDITSSATITAGALSINTRNKHNDDGGRWWQNNGNGQFVIRCDTIDPNQGCLKIETAEWGGGAPSPTFSTINTKGRLHIYCTEQILLMAKNVLIHRSDGIGATGNLSVEGNLTLSGLPELSGPTSTTRITAQGIIFGGANNGREANSAQISAGKHEADSLCIVGMSTGINAATRKITMWAEGGMKIYGIVYATSFQNHSDRRLKENIKNISETDKNKVLQLVPKTYTMIDDEKKTKRYGLIAQEVEELYPELVSTDNKGIKSMNYIELIPLLLEHIKELKKTIPNQDTLNIDGAILTKSDILKLKQLIM